MTRNAVKVRHPHIEVRKGFCGELLEELVLQQHVAVAV